MKYLTLIFTILLICILPLQHISCQSNDSPILFIYDASGSMWGKLDNATKKEVAADVLIKTIDALDAEQKIGFMAYGHRKKGDCEDVEKLVNIDNTDKSLLKSSVEKLNPLGKTPLAYSAKLAISDIEKANTKATIILITDGIESCGGDLCEVIRLAREKGIDFKLHIVGFGLKEGETEALKCAATQGNGNYYDAEDADQLAEVLDEAINQKVDDPIPNHTFYTTKNGEPVDAWIKVIEKGSGKETQVVRTYGDTSHTYIPNGLYTLTINPLAGSDIDSKTLELSKSKDGPNHNTISFDGGKIAVNVTNNGEGRDATVRVYNQATQKDAGTTRTYGRTPTIEVNTGTYYVVIQPLGIKGPSLKYKFEDVIVKANETNELSYDYKTGELLVGVSTRSGELVDATVNVNSVENNTNVANGRTYTSESSNPKKIIIQPGAYEVRIKSLGKHKGTVLKEKVEVIQGKSTTKIFKID